MRYALAAVILALAPYSAVAAPRSPSSAELIAAFGEANDDCRGSHVEAACARRDRISARLNQIGMCFGRKGEAAAQFDWHRCAAGSYFTTDLRPAD